MMVDSYYIAKVFKQHNSLVIVIPGVVCVALGIKAGKHVVFRWEMNHGDFRFEKFKQQGEIDDADNRNPVVGDKGRPTCAKT